MLGFNGLARLVLGAGLFSGVHTHRVSNQFDLTDEMGLDTNDHMAIPRGKGKASTWGTVQSRFTGNKFSRAKAATQVGYANAASMGGSRAALSRSLSQPNTGSVSAASAKWGQLTRTSSAGAGSTKGNSGAASARWGQLTKASTAGASSIRGNSGAASAKWGKIRHGVRFDADDPTQAEQQKTGYMISTFVDLADPKSGSRVFVLANDYFAKSAFYSSPVGQNMLSNACSNLGSTAQVFIGENPDASGTFAYPIRWYATAGSEYEICGHGNVAVGLYGALLNKVIRGNMRLVGAWKRNIMSLDVAGFNPRDKVADVTVDFGAAGAFETYSNPNIIAEVAQVLQIDPRGIVGVYLTKPGGSPSGIVVQVASVPVLQQISANVLPTTKTPLQDGQQYRGYMVFAMTGNPTFTCRCFYPQLGNPEDKATGSANGLLTYAVLNHVNPRLQSLTSKQINAGPRGFSVGGAFASKITNGNLYITGKAKLVSPVTFAYNTKQSACCHPADFKCVDNFQIAAKAASKIQAAYTASKTRRGWFSLMQKKQRRQRTSASNSTFSTA